MNERGESDPRDASQHRAKPSVSEIVDRLDGFWSSQQGDFIGPLRLSADDRIGPYTIERVVGAGAFGVVFKAIDRRNGTIVALKIPRPEMLSNKESILRFQSEVLANSRLDHPSIVPVYGSDLDSSTPYIASAFCEGPDLAIWLEANRTVSRPWRDIAQFVLQIGTAIAHAHERGVIHRDIKPSNIMMTQRDGMEPSQSLLDHVPKLTDFGLAKLTMDPIVNSSSSLVIGTPMYMAPEQLIPTWGPVTERTDLYSLGVLMFELIEGKPPRFGKNYTDILSLLFREFGANSVGWRQEVHRPFQQIAEKCLENDPVDRYANAYDLVRDLQAIVDGRSVHATKSRYWKSAVKWARNPKRPLEVCFFIIPLNVVLFLWMAVNSILMFLPDYQGSSAINDLVQCVALSGVHNLLIIVLCAIRILGKTWTMPLAFVLNLLVAIALPSLMLLGWLDYLDKLYPNAPYYRTAVLALVLLFGIFKTFLLGIAIYADSVARLRRSHR